MEEVPSPTRMEANSPEPTIVDMAHQLSALVKHLKEYLPKVLSPDIVAGYARAYDLEDEWTVQAHTLAACQQHACQLSRSRDDLMADAEGDKQEIFQLKSEIAQQTQLISEQASFCSTIGAINCNLLWKMSHCEGAVDSILAGNMFVEFLQLASSSLDGFISTCHGLGSEQSTEMEFVMAICGVLTNVLATSSGREYLMESGFGKSLCDQYLAIMGKDIKSLVLMAIYNISISQAGLEMVASRPALVPTLTTILNSSSMGGNHLQALQLLQSVSAEGQTSAAARDVMNQISPKLIQKFAKDSTSFEIRSIARDIISDLGMWQREP